VPVVAALQFEDIPAVQALLIAGLTERWGHYDASRNPDISSFRVAYGDGALVAKERGRVVGTATLRPLRPGTAEVVRMSVAAPLRRHGIGSLLLSQLLEQARERGMKEVVLETTTTWTSAVAFYSKQGFRKTHVAGSDTYFALTLSEA